MAPDSFVPLGPRGYRIWVMARDTHYSRFLRSPYGSVHIQRRVVLFSSFVNKIAPDHRCREVPRILNLSAAEKNIFEQPNREKRYLNVHKDIPVRILGLAAVHVRVRA